MIPRSVGLHSFLIQLKNTNACMYLCSHMCTTLHFSTVTCIWPQRAIREAFSAQQCVELCTRCLLSQMKAPLFFVGKKVTSFLPISVQFVAVLQDGVWWNWRQLSLCGFFSLVNGMEGLAVRALLLHGSHLVVVSVNGLRFLSMFSALCRWLSRFGVSPIEDPSRSMPRVRKIW